MSVGRFRRLSDFDIRSFVIRISTSDISRPRLARTGLHRSAEEGSFQNPAGMLYYCGEAEFLAADSRTYDGFVRRQRPDLPDAGARDGNPGDSGLPELLQRDPGPPIPAESRPAARVVVERGGR